MLTTMTSAIGNAQKDLRFLTLSEAAQLVRTKAISPVELTEACLLRIEGFNPSLNAYITVTAESALAEARKAEAEITRGEWKGPLHGIPLAVKDLLETAGVKTTAASAVLKDFVPKQDAQVVRRLREAGAVLLGKLNLHEFAYGGSGVIGHFGIARNPWNQAHIAGGSSSGSAVAVAAGLCYGAIGTDTGGSIRLPATFCGIAGFKPTYGLVSTRGVMALSWSFDHVGPMTRSVADSAAMLQAISGYDSQDVCSREFPPADYSAALEKSPSRLRLGVARDPFWENLDPEVEKAIEEAIRVLHSSAAEVREVTLPATPDRTVFRCEPFVYHRQSIEDHREDYHPETLRRIMEGSEITAGQYLEQFRELQLLRREIQESFREVDLIVTPTCRVLPPTISELQDASGRLREREIVMLANTRPFNIFGLPTISVPCGFSRSGLPIGLQITGAASAETMVLGLAQAYEQRTEWHKRTPPTGA